MAADTPAPIDPDRILEHSFTMVRRGLDPIEVQRFLLQLGNQIRAGREREADLAHRLEEADNRNAPIDELDPGRLTQLLGEETVRVLDAARGAAAEIRAKAEENVARLLREARDEAQEMRTAADTVLARRTEEADAAAAAIQAESAGLIDEAKAQSAELVESGRQEGREMVAEAQKVRQRMLDDLARRRKLLRQQIEQLQAGRDRLLGAYDVVRETLDVATEELHVALPEAKLAAEAAALAATEDDDEGLAEAMARATAEDVPTDEGAVERESEDSAAESTDPAASSDHPDGDGDAGAVAGVAPGPGDGSDSGAEADAASVDAEGEAADDETAGGESATDDGGEKAPDPEEGRRSSSVRVVRGEGELPAAKAGSLFARLRDAENDDTASDDSAPATDADAATVAADGATGETADMTTADTTTAAAAEPEDADDDEDQPLDPVAEMLARRDAAVASVEKSLTRRLKRELSDEQNELLASLTQAKGDVRADEVMPSPEGHVERYESIALPALASAATAGADLVSESVGPPASRTKVADLAAELAADVVVPLRERLERCFAEADGDKEEVAQRVRACYREWKGQRVDQIATQGVMAACNRGLLDGLPEGTMVHWVVSDGDSPSPDCDDNALAGAVIRGEPFPTGHVSPPIHAACRCLVIAVDL